MFQARKMTFSQFQNANISVNSGISNVLAVSLSRYIISRFASFASIVVDLWNVLSSLNVPKLLSAALRTPVIRKRSLNVRAQALYMGVRRKFSRGRARSTFRSLFSGCRRCNASGRSQSHLPFLLKNKFLHFAAIVTKNALRWQQ